jgi:D-lactate dehydrogenase
MKVLFFFAKKYDREFQSAALSKTGSAHTFDYVEAALGPSTVSLAKGYDAVSIFPNDSADKEVLLKLAEYGIKLILLRCAGFNNVDLKVAEELGITLLRVPSYSPEVKKKKKKKITKFQKKIQNFIF